METKTKKKEIEKNKLSKGVVQTKEEEIMEKQKKDENLKSEEKEVSKKIKKKSEFIGEISLKDENLINILKEKEISENKQQILDKLKKELHNLELDKKFEYIILINIGYFSSMRPIEGNFANIDFLSFIMKDLLLSEKYYKFGLISLDLFLNEFIRKERHYNRYQYNNFDLINLLNRLDKSDIEDLIRIIIKGTFQDEKISKHHQNFLQVLCNYIPFNINNIKEISFNRFFDILFMNNLELIEQYKIQFIEFIEENITEIFLRENLFTIFKHIYVKFYDGIKPLFQKFDDILQETLEDAKNVLKIIELVYFMERHWKHPFYEKFYREYFKLMYLLSEKRDIMSMGDLLLLFRYGSLESSENWESTYKPFFEKFLEDFRYFRSRKENNFNVAYEQLEIVVGQRPKREYIKTLKRGEKLPDIDKIFKLLFPEFTDISKISISDDNINDLYKMDDSMIRKSLLDILKDNNNLPETVRNKLKIEANKPHTGYEISDFEFPLKVRDISYYICIVIKSGKEINNDSVPINKVWHQLEKPFYELENAIVIFLTAKKASQVLKNMIKKHNSKNPEQPIEIIEKENFAKLFKKYKMI